MKKIITRRPPIDIPQHISIHPLLWRIYAARGVNDVSDIRYDLNDLLPFNTLSQIDRAVSLLAEAVMQDKHCMIIADFDADGATSCAVAVLALRAMGVRRVSYVVPNRFIYGYGLTPEIVDVAYQQRPDILITVDNGISSHAGVAHAKALGMKVLITDHHLPAATLPEADAIVNPNSPGDAFPSKCIAGVGVIFYVMLALRAYLREQKWFEHPHRACPNLAELLDIVALGTIADVVHLDRNNRILIHHGLQRIRKRQCRSGILALLHVAAKDPKTITASDLAFSIAPRLNAAGRLEDMSQGIACLLADNEAEAHVLAAALDQLNRERRTLEKDMQEQALASLDNVLLATEEQAWPAALCLFDESWHQGIIGLLASRLKDRYHRPTIVFAKGEQGELKGSARSVQGLHIRDALDRIACEHPDLMSKFGGHAMAAGLSLLAENLPRFRQAFESVVAQTADLPKQGVLLSDGELPFDAFNLEMAQCLRDAGPWGQGFTEPLFDGIFQVVEQCVVGEKHLRLSLVEEETGQCLEAIAFYVDREKWPNDCQKIHLAYRLDINEFRGQTRLQLLVEHMEEIV